MTSAGVQVVREQIQGMTLRDYFAAAALTGLSVSGGHDSFKELASDAYMAADAMLAARAPEVKQ